ncbi:MAG: hypothetical protein GX167_00320 [Firmicutes bacterium]|jgi:hypothetical protein|nr:hypothetical protein [Bacillota bacterium]
MPAAGQIPDVLCFYAAEAESLIRESGYRPSVQYSLPPAGEIKAGSLFRVIRQRSQPEANAVEITVAPEGWD